MVPVFQRLDNVINRINRHPVDKKTQIVFIVVMHLAIQAVSLDSVNKTNHAIGWIATYPVDSIIHLSNN